MIRYVTPPLSIRSGTLGRVPYTKLATTLPWLSNSAMGAGLHRDQERLVVLRAASRLAAVALPAQVGVIDLHEARELARRLTRSHRLHHLVLDAPRRLVVHAQMALQLQSRHVRLGRRQQMDGQQPGAQWQLGGFEDRSAEQGGLVPAAAALVVNLPAAAKARTPAVVVVWMRSGSFASTAAPYASAAATYRASKGVDAAACMRVIPPPAQAPMPRAQTPPRSANRGSHAPAGRA